MAEPQRDVDQELLPRLRSGDETAFAELVGALHGRLLAVARGFTRSPALAEDIVQETWLAVIRGLPGFEGRSALRTWIFSILVRRARSLVGREARRAARGGTTGMGPSGAPEWEPGAGKVGLWTDAPVPWGLSDPALLYQSHEALQVVRRALSDMPEMQRVVLLLRDVEDISPAELCNSLEISETNLRVLLHRGRARVRVALDHYLRDALPPPVRAGSGDTRRAGSRTPSRPGRALPANGGQD